MPKNDQLHLIDTSVLVNFEAQFGDSDNAWGTLIDEIVGGRLKTVRQVWDEIERRWPKIHARLKLHRKQFLVSDADLYSLVGVAEVRAIQQHHGKLINELGSGNPADPLLIAGAKVLAATVVTDERVAGKRHKFKIPFVCRARGVACKCGADYLKELGF